MSDMTTEITRVRTARASHESARLQEGVPDYSYSGGLVFINYVITAADDTAGTVTIPTKFSRLLGRPIVQLLAVTTDEQKTAIDVAISADGTGIVLRDGAVTTLTEGDIVSIIARGTE